MDFRGRAARNEFWWFFLFVMLFGWLVALFSSSGVPSAIWQLLTLCPLLAVGARRLHDIGRSGWWQLFYLTIYGALFLFVLFCLKSKTDEEIAAKQGVMFKVEKYAAKWRAKTVAWAKLHPFIFAAAAVAFVTLLYAIGFVVFHATTDYATSDCELSLFWSVVGGASIFLLLFPITGGATAIPMGSLGLAGSTSTLASSVFSVGGLFGNLARTLFCP